MARTCNNSDRTPLLLATTVRSFAHMPLGISDRNSSTVKTHNVTGSAFHLKPFVDFKWLTQRASLVWFAVASGFRRQRFSWTSKQRGANECTKVRYG